MLKLTLNLDEMGAAMLVVGALSTNNTVPEALVHISSILCGSNASITRVKNKTVPQLTSLAVAAMATPEIMQTALNEGAVDYSMLPEVEAPTGLLGCKH